jgi:hypothetical protein
MGGENICAHTHADKNNDGACDFCPVIPNGSADWRRGLWGCFCCM